MIDGRSQTQPHSIAGAGEPGKPRAASLSLGSPSLDSPSLDSRYEALRAELVRAVRRVCPEWLADRRDDLVQTALLRVMEIERRSEEAREFAPAYLGRTAYCALIDEIRKLRRRREVPLDPGDRDGGDAGHRGDRSWDLAAPHPGPQQVSQANEIGRGIRDCLGRMVRPRQMAVTLHMLGHGVPEVARLLRWSAKRAENLVYRGLDDLRRCLREKGLEP